MSAESGNKMYPDPDFDPSMEGMTMEQINKMSFHERISVLSQYLDYLSEIAAATMHKIFPEEAKEHEIAVVTLAQLKINSVLTVQTSCGKEALRELVNVMPTVLEQFTKVLGVGEGEGELKEQNAPSSRTVQ